MRGEYRLADVGGFYHCGREVVDNHNLQALPQWLLSSKQILQESLDRIRRNSTWYVFGPKCLDNPFTRLPPLMHLRNAQDLVVLLADIYNDYNPAGLPYGMRRIWGIDPRTTHALHPLWLSLLADANLQSLCIDTFLGYREWSNVSNICVLYRAQEVEPDEDVYFDDG
ncbi:uncharacterized protein CC84DRAFT_1221907 [Paraphaeosphaeria sporulosa]|uniref:Uncharacterized protein n=1 Tax=Paraphaeosphaeria sporulosa TaxID=1460663 RepID=A0A177C103_9PLEO|nr:uncharacterized protein CC84DRAFT_1221907 [Paraphaeosphaeria sporulosa]OAG00397.1 hypothetical protein CC84DRAFT_1221907 [Paraphaeosphaeria sporulosa]